jgi:large subunit ribosomal protein L3
MVSALINQHMKTILGTKEKMTQVFDETGRVHPATVIKAGPVVVTQVKTKAVDGYNAIQVGFGTKAEKNLSKALKGHFKDLGNFRYVREFRIEGEMPAVKVGDTYEAGLFAKGDTVKIVSVSKGRGFQGGVKRHGFHGGPRTHGQKHSEREVGSIGGSGGRAGGRVAKGMRMAGRMGSDRVTLKNVTIVAVNPETAEIYVRGAVAGRRGTLVEIQG